MDKEKQNMEVNGEQPEEQDVAVNTEPEPATAEATATEAAPEAEEPPPEEALAKLAAAYADLERQNRQLAEAKQALESQLTRLQADFDNFRRRTRQEKEDWQRNNTAAFCTELLPITDNFGRALQAMKASEADAGHSAGVEMIARQLAELMAAKGVERISALGEDFAPNWHEAIGQTPVEDEAQVGSSLKLPALSQAVNTTFPGGTNIVC